MSSPYEYPEYYELAFSYRDFAREVDVFEECIRRYSGAPVSRVLEICCGHAPHLPALHARGYRYIGLDRSERMLKRASEQAERIGAPIELIRQSLVDFSLQPPADFAFVALASLYARSTGELAAHFDCMARALRPGALYFLEWCVDFDPMVDVVDSWEVRHGPTIVRGSFWTRCLNRVEQIYEDTLHLDVTDNGARKVLEDKSVRRRIFPQEFLMFIAQHSAFEFVGWWNDWDLDQPLTGAYATDRPIVLVRRV